MDPKGVVYSGQDGTGKAAILPNRNDPVKNFGKQVDKMGAYLQNLSLQIRAENKAARNGDKKAAAAIRAEFEKGINQDGIMPIDRKPLQEKVKKWRNNSIEQGVKYGHKGYNPMDHPDWYKQHYDAKDEMMSEADESRIHNKTWQKVAAGLVQDKSGNWDRDKTKERLAEFHESPLKKRREMLKEGIEVAREGYDSSIKYTNSLGKQQAMAEIKTKVITASALPSGVVQTTTVEKRAEDAILNQFLAYYGDIQNQPAVMRDLEKKREKWITENPEDESIYGDDLLFKDGDKFHNDGLFRFYAEKDQKYKNFVKDITNTRLTVERKPDSGSGGYGHTEGKVNWATTTSNRKVSSKKGGGGGVKSSGDVASIDLTQLSPQTNTKDRPKISRSPGTVNISTGEIDTSEESLPTFWQRVDAIPFATRDLKFKTARDSRTPAVEGGQYKPRITIIKAGEMIPEEFRKKYNELLMDDEGSTDSGYEHIPTVFFSQTHPKDEYGQGGGSRDYQAPASGYESQLMNMLGGKEAYDLMQSEATTMEIGKSKSKEKAAPASDKNAAARKWAEANPNDPRAAAVLKKLEGK